MLSFQLVRNPGYVTLNLLFDLQDLLFCVLNQFLCKIFNVLWKIFNLLCKIFSMLWKVFNVLWKIFCSLYKIFSMLWQVCNLTLNVLHTYRIFIERHFNHNCYKLLHNFRRGFLKKIHKNVTKEVQRCKIQNKPRLSCSNMT